MGNIRERLRSILTRLQNMSYRVHITCLLPDFNDRRWRGGGCSYRCQGCQASDCGSCLCFSIYKSDHLIFLGRPWDISKTKTYVSSLCSQVLSQVPRRVRQVPSPVSSPKQVITVLCTPVFMVAQRCYAGGLYCNEHSCMCALLMMMSGCQQYFPL